MSILTTGATRSGFLAARVPLDGITSKLPPYELLIICLKQSEPPGQVVRELDQVFNGTDLELYSLLLQRRTLPSFIEGQLRQRMLLIFSVLCIPNIL